MPNIDYTFEFNADASGLEKGISDANEKLKKLQQNIDNLKSSDNNIKLSVDTKNIESQIKNALSKKYKIKVDIDTGSTNKSGNSTKNSSFQKSGLISSIEKAMTRKWMPTYQKNSLNNYLSELRSPNLSSQRYRAINDSFKQEMAAYNSIYSNGNKRYLESFSAMDKYLSGLDSSKYTGKLAQNIDNAKSSLEGLRGEMKAVESDPINHVLDPQATKDFDKLEKAVDSVKSTMKSSKNDFVIADPENVDKLISKFKELQSTYKLTDDLNIKIASNISDLSAGGLTQDAVNKAKESLKGIVNDIKEQDIPVNPLSKKGALSWLGEGMDTFGKRLSWMNADLFARFFSFNDIIRYSRELINVVESVDTSMKELQKVTGETDSTMQDAFSVSANTAKSLGSSITDVVDSTADWARLGYSLPDAENLAKTTTMYQNIAKGITQESASEYMVSTLQGFHIAADQSESVLDAINEVANNYAIDQAGIGEALERSAASFNASGTSLNEAIALVTATNETLQNPETVGTFWKTFSARVRGADTELQELGEDTDAYTQTTSKLRDLVKQLTGFDIMKNDNEYKDLYDIVVGIGEKWNSLTDIEQASLGEALAGKRNSNAFFALMSNIDHLKEAYKTAETSAGSAQKAQDVYSESVSAHIATLKAELQELATNFLSSDILNGIINIGKGAVSVLDTVTDHLGSLGSILATITLADFFKGFGGRGILNWLVSLARIKRGDAESFDDLGDSAKNIITNIGALKKSAKGVKSAGSGIRATISSIVSALGGLPTVLAVSIPAAIGAGYAIYKKYKEQLVENAKEASSAWQSQYTSLSDQMNQYADLRTQIDSGALSTDEEVSARQQILSIQNQIVSTYGAEAAGVDLVNGSLETQLATMQQIAQEEAEQDLSAHATEYKELAKQMAEEQTIQTSVPKTDTDAIRALEEAGFTNTGKGETMWSYSIDINPSDTQSLQKIIDLQKQMDSWSVDKGTAAEKRNGSNYYESVSNGLSTAISDLELLREENSETIKQIATETMVANNNGVDLFQQYEDAVSDYNAAISNIYDVDSQAADKAETKMNSARTALTDFIEGISGDVDAGTLELLDYRLQDITDDLDENTSKAYEFYKEINGWQRKVSKGNKLDYDKGILGITSLSKLSEENQSLPDLLDSLKALNLDSDEVVEGLMDVDAKGHDILIPLAKQYGLTYDSINDTITATAAEMESFAQVLVSQGAALASTADSVDIAQRSYNSFKDSVSSAIETSSGLTTILKEAVSDTGLTSDSIDSLKNLYGDEVSDSLEYTADGIRLNMDSLDKLKRAYSENEKSQYLTSLADQYVALEKVSEDLQEAGSEEEIEKLTAQREEILNTIGELQELQAQFNATQSLYAQWQGAVSNGSEREGYTNIGTEYKTVKDLLSRGWADDEVKSYLKLMTGAGDATIDTVEECQAVFDGLTQDIEGTSYSIMDFFTFDSNGKETADGVINFFDALTQKQAELNKNWVSYDENGNMKFDFDPEEVANALGISEDLVDQLVQAADEAGIVVTDLSQPSQDLSTLRTNAEEAQAALGNLQNTALAGLNLDASGADEISEQVNMIQEYIDAINNSTLDPDVKADKLEQANELLDYFVAKEADAALGIDISASTEDLDTRITQVQQRLNDLREDGKFSIKTEGVKEALSDLQELYKEKIALSQQNTPLATINTSGLDQNVQTYISTLREYQDTINEIQAASQVAAEYGIHIDTSEAETRLYQLSEEIQNFPDSVKTKLNIDTSQLNEITSKNKDITIQAKVKLAQGVLDSVNDADLSSLVGWVPDEESAVTNTILHATELDTSDIDTTIEVELVPKNDNGLLGIQKKNSSSSGSSGSGKVLNAPSIKNIDFSKVTNKSIGGFTAKIDKVDTSNAPNEPVNGTSKITNVDTSGAPVKTLMANAKVSSVDASGVHPTVGVSGVMNNVVNRAGSITMPITGIVTSVINRFVLHHSEGTAKAFAKGTVNSHAAGRNWGLKHDEDSTLINELGGEIIVRDGQAMIVNNGLPTLNFPLKKDDIIFNHGFYFLWHISEMRCENLSNC